MTRSNFDDTFSSLEEAAAPALYFDDIGKYFRRARDYLHGYREGKSGENLCSSASRIVVCLLPTLDLSYQNFILKILSVYEYSSFFCD